MWWQGGWGNRDEQVLWRSNRFDEIIWKAGLVGFWLERSPDGADGRELGTKKEERLSGGGYEASPRHLNLELLGGHVFRHVSGACPGQSWRTWVRSKLKKWRGASSASRWPWKV